MRKITIHTDGSCRRNPGPGGWAAILVSGDTEKMVSGYEPHSTSQRMELYAAIRALKALKFPCEVSLYSDSSYLTKSFNEGWLDNWIKNGWRTINKRSPVGNQDLWKDLAQLTKIHKVTWVWIKGHADNELNVRCDTEARRQSGIALEIVIKQDSCK